MITAGNTAICGIERDNNMTISCWGSNFYNILSDIPTFNNPVTQISVGNYGACAMDINGQVKCWGKQISKHNIIIYYIILYFIIFYYIILSILYYLLYYIIILYYTISHYIIILDDGEVVIPNDITAKQISYGDFGVCIILYNDTLRCYGDNSNYQINGSNSDESYIYISSGLSSVSCAINSSNHIKCFGNDDSNTNMIIDQPSSLLYDVSVGHFGACGRVISDCVSCHPGTSSNIGDSTCYNCKIGTYAADFNDICHICEEGYWCPDIGMI